MTGEDGSQPSLKRLGMYELLRPIARGGMADIYLAKKDTDGHNFERHVAIKVLSKVRATEQESCAMFLDEARLVGMLHHQNIAQVLEVGIADDHHYLAMEYVSGSDLRELLSTAGRAGRTIPFEVSLSIIAGAAAGLDHAHRRCDPDGKPLRLVHRDVSLSNIMVGHDGAVKVVDFGIASTAVQTVHTSPGVVRGKASYMSPEQCLGDEVDHTTDIFALGIVLYELTTGTRCFAGKTDFERMLSVVRGEYHPPSAIVSNYPAELEQVVRTALAADPGRRFASCHAMIEALEAVARGRGWSLGSAPIERLMRRLHAPSASGFNATAVTQPPWPAAEPIVDFENAEPTAREVPSARRAVIAAPREGRAVTIAAPREGRAVTIAAPREGRAVTIAARAVTIAAPREGRAVTIAAPPTEQSRRRLAQGTNADGYATPLDEDDDQPTRGRRPLPRRPSSRDMAA